MVDFVQPGDLQEQDQAMSRKVSRISFRPRGPVSDRNFQDLLLLSPEVKLFQYFTDAAALSSSHTRGAAGFHIESNSCVCRVFCELIYQKLYKLPIGSHHRAYPLIW